MTPEDIALSLLVEHLKKVRTNEPHTKDDDGSYVDSSGEWSRDSSAAPEIARRWCRVLLNASEADGMGGCRLCGG